VQLLIDYYQERLFRKAKANCLLQRKAVQNVFLIDNFTLPAMTIAEIYRKRWQIELFIKWIKQHLRINAFYGTSDNAVKV